MQTQPLNILLLEDSAQDAEHVKRALAETYHVVHYTTMAAAKQGLKATVFDMAIIDIHLDIKLGGIHFAQFLAANYKDVPFIFLTSMHDRAIFEQAKLTNPYTYLLKPFNKFELLYTIELALKNHLAQTTGLDQSQSDVALISPNYLFVKDHDRIVKLQHNDISYITVEDAYSTIVVEQKKYVLRLALKTLLKNFDAQTFVQVHRKYVVNSKKIKEFNLSEDTVYLDNGMALPISARFKRSLSHWSNIIK